MASQFSQDPLYNDLMSAFMMRDRYQQVKLLNPFVRQGGASLSKIIEMLGEMLNTSPDPELRKEIVDTSVWLLGNSPILQFLIDVLEYETVHKIREKIIFKLCSIADERAIEPLVKVLQHEEDLQLRILTCLTLIRLGSMGAIEWLISLPSRPEAAIIDKQQIIQEAIQLFDLTVSMQRSNAAKVDIHEIELSNKHMHEIEALVAALSDPKFGSLAYSALKMIGTAAVPALIEALMTSQSSDNFEIIELLGQLRDPRAIAPLGELLQSDRGEDVHSYVAAALESIGTPEAMLIVNKWQQGEMW